ncbi:hypothetical protein Tco_0736489 [Tanacetum coccineum]
MLFDCSTTIPKPCSTCSRVFVGDIYGDHAVSCTGIVGIKHRHSIVRDTLIDIYFQFEISAGKEVDIGLGRGRDKPLRPADMLLYSWDGGLDVCVDLTGVKDGPPGLLKSLQECITSYDTVVSKFTVCFNEEDCDATALDIHVVGDEVKRCQGIADGNRAHDSIITPANDITLKFVSLNIQCAGFDTRPPMLDRLDFESWKQRIRLYYLGKENGENILKSIDDSPFKMGKFRETLVEGALHLGLEQDRVFTDLTPEEKERYKADIRATNILLYGLPKYIYTPINHYTDAKDIWDNMKMLLEGFELTKDECESQLYDDFEHFCQNKGETIHEYYVRFTKLINDIRNIKMTMPKMHLNSKFVNNMLPEWGTFVTAEQDDVGKINQHVSILLLCILLFHSAVPTQSSVFHNLHIVPPVALLAQITISHLPQTLNNHLKPFNLNTRNQVRQNDRVVVQNVQGRQNRGQGNYTRGAVAAGNKGVQNRVRNANPCGQTNTFNDDDVDEAPVQDLALNEDKVFQVDQCDAFNSDVEEAPTAQTMLMVNLSSADPIYDEAGLLEMDIR